MVKHEKCFLTDLPVEVFEKTYTSMHPERRARIDRLKRDDDKKRSLAGEYLVRKMLSSQTGTAFDKIEIVADDMGKPYAVNVPLKFSISHSESLIVAAVSDKNIGIDAEMIHAVSPRLINRVCTENELCYVLRNDAADFDYEKEIRGDELRRFFEIWTLKEAYFKCIGTGITDFKSVDVFSENIVRERLSIQDYEIHTVTLK